MQHQDLLSINNLPPELKLIQVNQLTLLKLQHQVGNALIASQGAQLLQWHPSHSSHPVLWLSEIEPYEQGKAIRGGIPICFPWFNNNGTPAHGFARINQWQLQSYDIQATKVRLVFELFFQNKLQAEIRMTFSHKCQLEFINHAQPNAQLALHSYFNLSHIQQVKLQGLGTHCFDSLTQQHQQVADPRLITEHLDCIYPLKHNPINTIQDQGWQRTIKIEHHNASDVVVWNPWHKATSAMSDQAYENMLCVETARINKPLGIGEKVGLTLSLIEQTTE